MSDTSGIPEPTPARPWRREDGPEPKVTTYPRVGGPVLEVFSHGAWRWAPVAARQDRADSRVFYQVSVDLAGTTSITRRNYEWPQPGLRVAERLTATTSGDGWPTPRPRRPRPDSHPSRR
ncbi:hypothetical protein ACWEQN_38715 [Streptomyces sp. NPDC004129]